MKGSTKIALTSTVLIAMAAFAVLITGIGSANEVTTTSNATVSEYVAIALSDNLSAGIKFGTVSANTNDNNATSNADGTGGNTTYWINISAASTVNVDICIKDNVALTFGAETIPNTGYTYNSTTDGGDGTSPALPGTAITTIYAKFADTNLAPGTILLNRYWLDVPLGQVAGTYNNTVLFNGITTGGAC